MNWKDPDEVRAYKLEYQKRYVQERKLDLEFKAKRKEANSRYYQKNKDKLNARARSKRTPIQLISASKQIL